MNGPRYLVARGQRTSLRLALPAFGRLTVGAGDEADIQIREPGVAANHLELFVDHGIGLRTTEPNTKLVPFESTGGDERDIPPGETHELNLGDRVRIGRAEIVFAFGIEDTRPNRIWTQAYLVHQLQSALWEASEHPRLAVIVLQFPANTPDSAVEGALFDRVGAHDIVAALGECRLGLMVAGISTAEGEHVARSLARALDRQGYSVQVGWAFPSDAEDPEDLLDLATRRLARVEGGQQKQATLSSEDPETAKVFSLVHRVATSAAHILVQGETGTGKEVLVEALRIASPQAQKHMVRVRGNELSEAALERKDGPWARAAGGLLFIDEITSLPARAQVILAQMLDDERPQAHQRVRLMATTNQDLQALSEQGRFRTDLYYRLNQVALVIPPLRKRRADILPLAGLFIAEAAESLGRKPPQLTKAAEAQLLAYGWPGNIRELRNVMERAVLTCTSDTLGNDLLPPEIAGVAARGAADEPVSSSGDQPKSLRAEMAALERRRILEALEKYPTQTDAAKALDIPLRTFLNRLDALGIPRARKPAKGK